MKWLRASTTSSSSRRTSWQRCIQVGIVSLGVLATGCTQPEIDRPGTWQATGVNDQNLRAMLVNPRDAYLGTGTVTARGDSGARAATRLLTDRRRQLLDAAVSRVAPAGGSPADTPLASGGGLAGSAQ